MSIENIPVPVELLLKRLFSTDQAPWPVDNNSLEEKIFTSMQSHSMLPILAYRNNKTHCLHGWPETLRSKIKHSARLEAVADLLLEAELKNVLQAMEDISIHPILLKGTPLSYSLYPTPGLRPRCDTDLLIAEQDIDKTFQLMRQLGYESLYDAKTEFLSSQITYIKRSELNINYAYDLHWRISNASRSFSRELSYSSLYDSAMVITRLGTNAKTLNHVDALLLACFHRAGHFSHSGDRLIWLYDIHLLVTGMAEDEFFTFYQKAQKLEIIGLCADAIFTAQAWFGTILSKTAVSLLSSATSPEVSIAFLRPGRLTGIKNRAVLELKGLSSWRERLRFLFQKAFPPVNYMLWRYHLKKKCSLPFFYLFRILYGLYIFIRR